VCPRIILKPLSGIERRLNKEMRRLSITWDLSTPTVIQIGVDAFLAAEFCYRIFTPKTIQDNTDLFLGGELTAAITTDILDRLFCV